MPPKIRGPNWTPEEQLHLMQMIEDTLPINPDDWLVVQSNHTKAYPGRTIPALQRVFNDLARVTEPTGDPNIPPAVKMAKILRHRLREKTDGTMGSPDAEDGMMIGVGDEFEQEEVRPREQLGINCSCASIGHGGEAVSFSK